MDAPCPSGKCVSDFAFPLPSTALIAILVIFESLSPVFGMIWHGIEHDYIFTQLALTDHRILQVDTFEGSALVRTNGSDPEALRLGSIYIQTDAPYPKLADQSSLLHIVFCYRRFSDSRSIPPHAHTGTSSFKHVCANSTLHIQRWKMLTSSSSDRFERLQTEFELAIPWALSVIAERALYEFRIYVEANLADELAIAVSPLRFFIVDELLGHGSGDGDMDKNHASANSKQRLPAMSNLDNEPLRPFISIIFTGTNDSPQFLRRVCLMLSSLTQMIITLNISAEIVVVDWGSFVDFPPFGNQIAHSCVLFFPVRVVVVPKELYFEMQNDYSEAHPNVRDAIYDTRVNIQAAKNVGARRSRGEFLVFINGDTIISPALLTRLGPTTLKRGYIYRAARWELGVGNINSIGSGLYSDVLAAFKHFESECNIAQNTRFVDLNHECRKLCSPDEHCFDFRPSFECLAADMGDKSKAPEWNCPNPVGFEDFCNKGVHPELNDEETIMFTDASGTPLNALCGCHLCCAS